ncbi:hypothetical protein MKW94_025909, partial [Papaver nudicaule]|nr:hypothetical protein [Papaver nudicaule]
SEENLVHILETLADMDITFEILKMSIHLHRTNHNQLISNQMDSSQGSISGFRPRRSLRIIEKENE